MTTARKILIALVIMVAVGVVVAAMVFLNRSYDEHPFQGDGSTKTVNRATDASEQELASRVEMIEASFVSETGSLYLPESSDEPPEISSEDPFVVPDIQQLIDSIKSGTYRPKIELIGTDVEEPVKYNPIVEPVSPFEDTPENSDPDPAAFSEYKMHISVKDTDGHPIPNAKVTIEKDVYYTDADGRVETTTKFQNPQLIISVSDRAPYYEELELTDEHFYGDIILANAVGIRSLLNSQDLHPYVTNDEEINKYIEALLKDLTDDTMDTYTKVVKCYEYMIRNTYYKSPSHWKRPYQNYYWSCGYQCLCEGYGTCNCYSAAFTLLMRRIGLECYVVEGYTTSSKGGYTDHEWTVILMGGQYYIFDCQVEDAIMTRAGNKVIDLIRFGLPQNHEKYQYRKWTLAERIRMFQEYIDKNGHYVN